ncbi:MFS transporter [Chromobacterium rhizoryzae]|uniref:MFS transporter n=1 Tax=Chromobacterium rhizoryzae TaxID=1778675 RepID=UPI001D08BFF4|nr:MFS transporter [Chromobacterium rhizoryzae]
MQDKPIDISEFIDNSPLSRYQIMVLTLCFLIVLLDGFDTAAIGYIAPELISQWGISRGQLAPAFGAGLFGMLIGNFAFGPVADRLGRKRVLLLCTLIFGLGTLVSARSESITELALLRFATGIGLGGVLPNCITLSSEYSPARHRMLLVTLSYAGFTAGLALGGGVASQIIPLWGWQGVLAAGGLAPLLLLPFIAWLLPESVCYLAGRPDKAAALRRIVARINPDPRWRGRVFRHENAVPAGRSPAGLLFIAGTRARTLLLWLTFFCCLFVFYLLTNWMPTILRDHGYSTAQAARISAMVPLGGAVGGVLMAMLMDRIGARRVLPWLCLLAALALSAVGAALGDGGWLFATVFLVGFSLTGALNNLSILAATLYPTQARATGVSWALAAGRAGSIIGSMTGALLFAAAGSAQGFFAWAAAPVLAGALALFAMSRLDAAPAALKPQV